MTTEIEPSHHTLTIDFAHPGIESLVIDDCVLSTFFDSIYTLPDGGEVDQVVEAMVAQSEGRLHAQLEESIDGYVMFDIDTKTFTLWTGDGENKNRGFRLDTQSPLPYILRIEAVPAP